MVPLFMFLDPSPVKHFLLFFALVFALTSTAQQLFPTIECETLADRRLAIPKDLKGKRSVICLAMSPKAERLLRVWNHPLYNALIADGMGGLMGGKMYNAQLCFVGMLKGIAKIGLNEAKNKSKKEIDKTLYSNFMVSEDSVSDLTKLLGIRTTSEPHFFILDDKGIIIYQTQGAYSEEKMNALTDKLLE